MGRPYQLLFDHYLVHQDPEQAHEAAFSAIQKARPLLKFLPVPGNPVTLMGIRFPNRFGLAAGFDKNGAAIDALAAMGFGHIEIGTVTAQAQPGNPKPRLFRLISDRAVVNRMGFNNEGAAAVAARLEVRRHQMGHRRGPILGINIGKTKVVPDDDQAAVEADYATSAQLLAPYADYLVVNVSSPNTPGLRTLQAPERLAPLLEKVRTTADAAAGRHVPLLVKIAPDLSDEDVIGVADMALAMSLDGIIATNTTISRDGLRSHPSEVDEIGAGGVSGRPVAARSLEVLRLLKSHVGDRLVLIAVGGVSTPEQAQERLDAGASLVQGYTGFIYEGPLWPRRIAGGLA